MDSQYVSQPNDTPLHFHHGRGKPPANLDNPKGLSSDEQELASYIKTEYKKNKH